MRPQSLVDHFAARGARFAAGDQQNPVLSFGDVPAEYRAGREGALLVDATRRGRVVATGKDRADFLHRILANEVRGLAPGAGNSNLLLSPKGKIVEAFELCVAEDAIVLEADEGRGASLRAAVDMFLFSEKVVLEDHSARVAPLGLCGPRADAIASAVLGGAEVPTEIGHWREAGGVRVVRALVCGSRGLRLDAGPDGALDLWRRLEAAGARPGGLVADDCLRAEAGQARFLVDVDDNVYPQEARLERAFSLSKGCYTGQEVVAKIDTYGGLNKRLVTVEFDGEDPVARGTQLVVPDEESGGERSVGLVTTWAYSFERDRPIGLAYVKRRHQKVGTSFGLASGGRATVVPMPIRADGEPVTGEFE